MVAQVNERLLRSCTKGGVHGRPAGDYCDSCSWFKAVQSSDQSSDQRTLRKKHYVIVILIKSRLGRKFRPWPFVKAEARDLGILGREFLGRPWSCPLGIGGHLWALGTQQASHGWVPGTLWSLLGRELPRYADLGSILPLWAPCKKKKKTFIKKTH